MILDRILKTTGFAASEKEKVMTGNPAPTHAGAIYAAIAALSPAQQTMLTEISKSTDPVTVTELSKSLKLHSNSVRTTLDSLMQMQLIDRQVLRRSGRGRPSWGYFALAPDSAAFAAAQMVELAHLFCGTLRGVFDDPDAEARRIGRAWGDQVITELQADACMDPQEQAKIDIDARISQMRVLFTSLGTAAAINKTNPRVIDLRSCPFATRDGTVDPLICQMHAGLVERITECAYGPNANGDLLPLRHPGVCQVEISECRRP
ncbi:helix-turn-helix transcriptional regulator [Trueperella pyogenes]